MSAAREVLQAKITENEGNQAAIRAYLAEAPAREEELKNLESERKELETALQVLVDTGA